MERYNGKEWGKTVLLVMSVMLCLTTRLAAQGFPIYDPTRHLNTVIGTAMVADKFDDVNDKKKKTLEIKRRTYVNVLLINTLDDYLYTREKRLDAGNLDRMRDMYSQVLDDIDQLWSDYYDIYVAPNDTLRARCGEYYNKAKEISDYEVGQIERKVDSYIASKKFLANNRERIVMMEACLDDAQNAKMRVIKHGRILFSLGVYSDGFKAQRVDVLKNLLPTGTHE